MRFVFAAAFALYFVGRAYGQSCDVEGVWQLVSRKVEGQEAVDLPQQIKLITHGRFSWVSGSADSVNTAPTKATETYRVFKSMSAGGGTYTSRGNGYMEHIEYFPDVSWIGLSLPFTCRTEGAHLFTTGTLPVFDNGRKTGDVRVEETYRRLERPNQAADLLAVSAAVRSYADAWLANDADAIAAHLDENVVISTPPQPDIKGRAAAREVWGKVLTTSKVKQLTLRDEPITLSGDLAVAPGEFAEIVEVQGQAEPMRLNGRYLAVWQRGSDGAWRILRFMGVERAAPAQ